MFRSTLASHALRVHSACALRNNLFSLSAARRVPPMPLITCQVRGCTDAVHPPSSAEPRRNLYELASGLPNYGLGAKVYRSSWASKGYAPSDYHWIVTKIMLKDKGLEKQLKRGAAWGILRWKGILEEKPRRIPTGLKKEWCHLFEQ